LTIYGFRGDVNISWRTRPISLRAPLALFLISLSTIAAVWWWLATPVTLAIAPIDPATKLDCVSYAPFRKHQTPWNSTAIISPEQISEDLAELSKVSKCVRTYSVENGLDKVPELASRVGLKVILGIWLGRDRAKNALLIDTAISEAEQYRDVVTTLMVGSEVLLRGEMLPSELRKIILSVKARTTIPVSYADVWEFWLRYQDLSDAVDFVTIHILPYWEDLPVRAEDAAAHVDDIRNQVALAFPGKEILIGEAGWPSKGRMRDGAQPSRVNQARFISGILDRSRQQNYRVNLFEAYDEPWKRQWEGTVGAHWGLFDGETRALKYPPGFAISNYPFWKLQLGSGLVLGISMFCVAFWTVRRRQASPGLAPWIAVAISATVGGVLLGLSAEQLLFETYGIGDPLMRSLLLAAGIAASLLSSNAVMSGGALPTFPELMDVGKSRTLPFPTIILGVAFTVTTLIAAENALAFVFDPRWRDFQFAGIAMAALPFWTLALLNRPKSGARPAAETVFAGLFTAATIYVTFNEGFDNWQSLWTSAAYFLLIATLWQARSVAVARIASIKPIMFPEAGLLEGKAAALDPIGVAREAEPTLLGGAVARVRSDGQRPRP
jgi:exo-beta-1,3-glucanase (GH17 family)